MFDVKRSPCELEDLWTSLMTSENSQIHFQGREASAFILLAFKQALDNKGTGNFKV